MSWEEHIWVLTRRVGKMHVQIPCEINKKKKKHSRKLINGLKKSRFSVFFFLIVRYYCMEKLVY